jgi:hypothetical protein
MFLIEVVEIEVRAVFAIHLFEEAFWESIDDVVGNRSR